MLGMGLFALGILVALPLVSAGLGHRHERPLDRGRCGRRDRSGPRHPRHARSHATFELVSIRRGALARAPGLEQKL